MRRRWLWTGWLSLVVLVLVWGRYSWPQPVYAVDACPGKASALIQLVNAFRANLGLPAYQVHPIVMAVAQAHSEYQAGIDKLTHIGPGGTRPKDRLRAAGYGNGGNILVSENIAWGYHMDPQGAMDLWIPSAIHYYTLTIPGVRHVGAGCATSKTGKTYYTLDVAWAPGTGLPPPPPGPPPPNPSPRPSPTPTLDYVPVIPSTPRPDGAIVHVVQPGQTLMMIALSYRVPLEDILKYNNLTRTSIIYPGDEIIIRPPQVTPTATPTATPTPRPTATPGMAISAATPPVTPTPTATARPMTAASTVNVPPAVSVLLGLVLWGGTAWVGWMIYTRRHRPPVPD